MIKNNFLRTFKTNIPINFLSKYCFSGDNKGGKFKEKEQAHEKQYIINEESIK